MTVRILPGLDGKEKMSKSLGNYIGITEDSANQFGKVMSIPDSMIFEYFSLCTTIPDKEIKKYQAGIKKGMNPRDIKEILAKKIVALYHDEKEADKAAAEFTNIFSKKELPKEMPTVKLSGNYLLPALLLELGITDSNSEAKRLIEQGGVKIDSVKFTDPKSPVALHKDMVIQVGKKKYFKVK